MLKYYSKMLGLGLIVTLAGCNGGSELEEPVFESNDVRLELKDYELVESDIEGEGIYVTFNIENKSDELIVPNEVVSELNVYQVTESSTVALQNNYSILETVDSEDVERYNELVDESSLTYDQVNPGASFDFTESFNLEDSEAPVYIEDWNSNVYELNLNK